MLHRTFLISFVFIVGLSGTLSSARAVWEHEKTEDSVLQFTDPAAKKTLKLRTGLRALQFHALLSQGDGPIYALYSGLPCEKCGTEQMAVFMSRIDGSGAPFQFVYPGEVRDPKRGVVFRSRAFYGYCLPKIKAAYVSHQGEHVDRRRGFQKSVLVAEPGAEKVQDKLIESRLPRLRTTLDLVKRKQCFEIPGRTRTVMKKIPGPHGNGALVADEDDDEDEDEAVEEKKSAVPTSLDPPADDEAKAPAEAPAKS